jgi:hypothetical protein
MRRLSIVIALVLLAGCAPSGPQKRALPLAALQGPALQVTLPARQARAVLSRSGVNGDVETWQAVDAVSVSFDRGVLVASRGLGHDLMGADAAGTLAALRGEGAEVYRRKMRYLDGQHHSFWLNAGCSIRRAGIESGLRRVDESCKTHAHSFTNRFWLDDAGRIRRARQWVSPEVGYLEANW